MAANQTLTTGGMIQNANSAADQFSGMGILKAAFGDKAADPMSALSSMGAAADVPGSMFSVLNSGICVLGAILTLYVVLTSIVQTAHEGEALGQRYDSLWLPARYITGIFAMLPAFGGWCLAQIIMLWFAAMGVGLGNMVWGAAIDGILKQGSLTNSPIVASDRQFVEFKYQQSLCMASIKLAATLGSNANPAIIRKTGLVGYGDAVSNDTMCGAVSLPSGNGSNAALQQAMADANDNLDITINNQFAPVVACFQTAPTAPGWSPAGCIKQGKFDINQAVANYQSDLSQRLKAAVGTLTNDAAIAKAKANAAQQGFTGAGMFYFSLATDTNKLTAIQGLKPGIALPVNFTQMQPYVGDPNAIAVLHNILASDLSPGNNKGESGIWATLTSGFCPPGVSGLGNCIVAQVTQSGANPSGALIRMKNLGDYLSGGSATALLAVSAASGAADGVKDGALGTIASKIPGLDMATGAASAVAKTLADNILMGLKMLFGLGIVMSTYLPLIPAISFFAAIVSWFVTVLEGVVAAPIWAATHLSGEGQGMGAKTERGYLYLANLILRPTIMIIAFVFASIGVEIFGGMWTASFGQIVTNVQGDSMTGLFSIVAFVAIYVLVMVSTVTMLFNTVHTLTDHVISWATGNVGATVGAELAKEAGSKMHGGAASVTAGGLGRIRGGRGTGAGKPQSQQQGINGV